MRIENTGTLLHKIAVVSFHISRKFFHMARYFSDFIIAKLCYKTKIGCIYKNEHIPLKENVCIFSHYDPHNVIDSYVVYYLHELARYCNIIFVTTCKTLDAEEIIKISCLCKQIIIKNNRGLDFAAYKLGLLTENNLNQYQRLLFVNDSVYGPFFDLHNIIHYGDSNNLDMWGATDSHMIKYHIQSYFIVFSKAAFQTKTFHKFWKNIQNLSLKNNIIVRYEIGLSQYFLKHHFKVGAYCTYPENKNSKNIDPCHHRWSAMIVKNKHPFIKRMLIRDNPHHVVISHWQRLIEKESPYNCSLILNHLSRTG